MASQATSLLYLRLWKISILSKFKVLWQSPKSVSMLLAFVLFQNSYHIIYALMVCICTITILCIVLDPHYENWISYRFPLINGPEAYNFQGRCLLEMLNTYLKTLQNTLKYCKNCTLLHYFRELIHVRIGGTKTACFHRTQFSISYQTMADHVPCGNKQDHAVARSWSAKL